MATVSDPGTFWTEAVDENLPLVLPQPSSPSSCWRGHMTSTQDATSQLLQKGRGAEGR